MTKIIQNKLTKFSLFLSFILFGSILFSLLFIITESGIDSGIKEPYSLDRNYFPKLSAQEINITTPENKTYNGPMSGYYPGTYSFDNDEVGGLPEGWVSLNKGGSVSIVNYIDGHHRVVQLYDNNGGEYTSIVQNVSEQIAGTVEWWWRTNDAAERSLFILYGDGGNAVNLEIIDDNFYYFDGAIKTVIGGIIPVDNTWYHSRIDFNCSTDTADIYINGILRVDDGNFRNPANYIFSVKPQTGTNRLNYYAYFDAIGYSWDSDYNVGDNLAEGLLVSFKNNTNLGWMGYSLDGQANKTINGNTTISLPIIGTHSIQVSANDSSTGAWYESDVRYFTINGIDLITPENRTYTSPISGYYPGTHGFEDTPNGMQPKEWSNESTMSGLYVKVAASRDGHNKILHLDDTTSESTNGRIRAHQYFSNNQSDGTLEWWIQTSSVFYSTNFGILTSTGGWLSRFRIISNDFSYWDGSTEMTNSITPSSNTWYRFSVSFNSSYKWNFTIYNEVGTVLDSKSNLDYGVNDQANNLYILTGGDGIYDVWIDAVGYSWENYNIGDNENEGLLLSYENSTSIDWMGYSLDGQSNESINGNTTISMPNIGTHSIKLSANDSSTGTWYESELRYFTISTQCEYEILNPGINHITIESVPKLDIEINLNAGGYLDIDRKDSEFKGIEDAKSFGAELTVLYYYNFTLFDSSMDETDQHLINALILFYYEEDIKKESKLRLLKYVWDLSELIWVWESQEIMLNDELDYVQFNTTELSIFCLVELKLPPGQENKESSIWAFITENIVVIIVLSAIGISIPTGYTVISRKNKKKAVLDKKKIEKYSELREKAKEKQQALRDRTWQPEIKKVEEETSKSPESKSDHFFEISGVSNVSKVHTPKKKKAPAIPKKPLSPEEKLKIAKDIKKTEQEMQIKPREDFCLIHRGELEGITYICPKCKTKYCLKCAKLIRSKNEPCWICETPVKIDMGELKDNSINDYLIQGNGQEKLQSTLAQDKPLEEMREFKVTALSAEFIERFNKLDMTFEEKRKFLEEMISLTPKERNAIIDDMLKVDDDDFLG